MAKLSSETNLEYKHRVIDIKSDSFCAAKWYNATIWLGSGQTTSCHHTPAHSVIVDDLELNPSALHNTAQKKEERAMMQRGERPAGCEYCWKIEDMGTDAVSDRVFKTIIYDDTELEQAINMPIEKDVNLKTLEMAFDRTCQFACSYCNPAFSSTWVRDIKTNGPYEKLISDGRGHFTHQHNFSQLYTLNEVNPYAEAFFKWWETDLHKTLTELRITGGEPLMSGYTWRLFDWFKENRGKSKTRLAINTNLGFKRDVLERLLDSTQGIELDIYTSNEAMDKDAEYIRDGLDWEQWYDNVRYLLGTKQIRGLHVMCTINAICLVTLPKFLNLIIDLKREFGYSVIDFSLNMLRFPSFQSSLVLPDNLRHEFRQNLINFLNNNKNNGILHESELDHIIRLIDYLEIVKSPHSDAFEIPMLQRDFKNFYEQYDQRRGKNFKETFPQLVDWYNTL